MSKLFTRFAKDESGATAIEYGLIAALVAVGVIAGASVLGDDINEGFSKLGSTLVEKSTEAESAE